ncbi:MAG: helix-turn-helix transcriptional regulator [Saprospiraceae bacterium]
MNLAVDKIIKTLPQKRQKRIHAVADGYIKEYKTLQEFRKSLGLTQSTIADRQGVKQVNISNLEKRTDMHISTLKKYVEALGCELEINIKVPDKTIARIDNLI